MSVAEMKEEIVRQVIMSDDQAFLSRVAAFISTDKQEASSTQESEKQIDIQAFWKRLTSEYGEVLQKLAQ